MPNRSRVMQKILLSSVCPDKKSQEANDGRRDPPGKCFELQSRLSKEQQNAGNHLMDMQIMAHPPVERLSTNVGRQRLNRFARELYAKYPSMLLPKQDNKQEMADTQVGITSYRYQYRDPNEVIAELERTQLLRSSMVEWKPDRETSRLPGQQYRSGSKTNFTQNEWGPRKMAAEKHAEHLVSLKKKEPKFYPWISEYQANIESMAKLIIDKDIFRKEKVLVRRVHTLPD